MRQRGYWQVLGCLVAVWSGGDAAADPGLPLHGHIKVQQQYDQGSAASLPASLDEADVSATTLDLRLIGRYASGAWALAADYQLSGVWGNAVRLQNRLAAVLPQRTVDREAAQWLRLSDTLVDNDHARLRHSLDRFYLGHSSEHFVFRLGRQALSWGNGLVFRPMDLFDPFAPDATDTSYKPGIDMVYGQWLFDDGSDLTGLIVPRRNPGSGDLEQKQSSAAVKWHGFGASLQTDLLLARDYDDTVLALGLSGPWAQAVWRISLVPTFLGSGDSRASLVANLENAWQWQGRNISAYVEYFRNGFGRSDRGYTLTDLSAELTVRLARGQLFNSGSDYLASGLRLAWTPLLEVNPLLIFNLNDGSAMFSVQGSYSINQDMALVFGGSTGLGARGSEFGGIETEPGSSVYLEPPSQINARLAYYF